MRAIDGTVHIRDRDDVERWPGNAVCDLTVTNTTGASAAVYLTASDTRALIRQLTAQLPPEARS